MTSTTTLNRAAMTLIALVGLLAYSLVMLAEPASAGIFDPNTWKSIGNNTQSAAVSLLGAALFIVGIIVFVQTKSVGKLLGLMVVGGLAIGVGLAMVNNTESVEKSVKTDIINSGSGR